MITEKKLERRSKAYAAGVVHALTRKSGPRVLSWSEAQGLIQVAHFNGFQSGVVWQKKTQEEEAERPFKVEVEIVAMGGCRAVSMEKAVTEDGHFIGTPQEATVLWKKFGITEFKLRTKKSKVCSIGYSPTKALWFGWSHRAIRGFKTHREASRFAESVS